MDAAARMWHYDKNQVFFLNENMQKITRESNEVDGLWTSFYGFELILLSLQHTCTPLCDFDVMTIFIFGGTCHNTPCLQSP